MNLHVQMKTFVDEFKDFTAGPTKWESLCKFLWDVYGAALVEWLEDARKVCAKFFLGIALDFSCDALEINSLVAFKGINTLCHNLPGVNV